MPVDLNDVVWSEFPLFHNVSEDVARKFVSMGFCFQFEVGTPLVSNNDLGETFFIILQGLAKLVLVNNQQEEVNLTLFRVGDFFGELAMLEPTPTRSANIIAVTDIEVVAIQKKEFLKAMHQHPEMALNIARVLGQRLRAMNERMVTERLVDDICKVAHTLLQLSKKGKLFNEPGTVLLPPLSLKEWALFCYTSREGFMESMETLKEMKAIEWQNQRIVITNLDVLHRVAEKHPSQVEGVFLP